jgi:hypothetical protein
MPDLAIAPLAFAPELPSAETRVESAIGEALLAISDVSLQAQQEYSNDGRVALKGHIVESCDPAPRPTRAQAYLKQRTKVSTASGAVICSPLEPCRASF